MKRQYDTKSRARFGFSRELKGSVSGQGGFGGRPPNQRNPYWISGLGRGRVGSCLGRGRVEVASRSSPGRSRVCARISSMSILHCVSSGGGKQPTILLDSAPRMERVTVITYASSDREDSLPLLSKLRITPTPVGIVTP